MSNNLSNKHFNSRIFNFNITVKIFSEKHRQLGIQKLGYYGSIHKGRKKKIKATLTKIIPLWCMHSIKRFCKLFAVKFAQILQTLNRTSLQYV